MCESPPERDLCETRDGCGVYGLIEPRMPPLSFGHFPRERGKPWSFAKVSWKGEGMCREDGCGDFDHAGINSYWIL